MGTSEPKKTTRNGILDNIENFLTSNYGKKEDLRALDKTLREGFYTEFIAIRHRWEKVYLGILEADQNTLGRECKKVIQIMDRLAASVNRADYGYAPIFDRVEKIQEKELTRMLEYDKSLGANIAQISKDVEAAEDSLDQINWPQMRINIEALKKTLSAFDESWRNRKQAFG